MPTGIQRLDIEKAANYPISSADVNFIGCVCKVESLSFVLQKILRITSRDQALKLETIQKVHSFTGEVQRLF